TQTLIRLQVHGLRPGEPPEGELDGDIGIGWNEAGAQDGIAAGRGNQDRRHTPMPRVFPSHTRAKKLARAAECLVYSLTPSGVLAETTQKIGVSSASCGVKNA